MSVACAGHQYLGNKAQQDQAHLVPLDVHDTVGLMTLEAASGSELKGLDNAWRGAEAYHFWLLAHQQLYNGQVN